MYLGAEGVQGGDGAGDGGGGEGDPVARQRRPRDLRLADAANEGRAAGGGVSPPKSIGGGTWCFV